DDRRSKSAISDCHRVHCRSALLVVHLQCLLDRPLACEVERKHPCVDDRLAAGLGPMWAHRMRRVSKQCYTPEAPSRERITIVHDALVDVSGAPDEMGKPEPLEIPVPERGEEALPGGLLVPALMHSRCGAAGKHGDPIDARAFAARRSADRIDHSSSPAKA